MKKDILILLLSLAFAPISAQTFTSVGIGTNAPVKSLVSFDDGISVGGEFTDINGFERVNHCKVRETSLNQFTFFNNYIQDFNTSSLGVNFPSSTITAGAWFNQRLHLGGLFLNPTYSGPVSIGYFDTISLSGETKWNVYNNQLTDSSQIFSMQVFDGKLYFGGSFTSLSGARSVAYIESNDYPFPKIKATGNNLYGTVYCLESHNDSLYAGGLFSLSDTDSVANVNLAVWRDTIWESITGHIDGPVYSLYSSDTGLWIGGGFSSIDSASYDRIVLYNDNQLITVGGFNDSADTVFDVIKYGGDYYAAGTFEDSSNYYNIARWSDDRWVGIGKVNGTVYCLGLHRGRLYLGGDFTKAEKEVSRHLIAYHNGREPLQIQNITRQNKSFSVWPNPSNGSINIDVDGEVSSISIVDMVGKQAPLISQSTFDRTVNYQITKSGVYTILVSFVSGEVMHQKISIIR